MAEALYDMFGEEIQRGRLVCYAASNQMKFGIIDKIHNDIYMSRRRFFYIDMWTTVKRSKKIDGFFIEYDGLMKYKIRVVEGEIESRMMVLNNPAFYVDSPGMEKQIKIADLLKDTGRFPRNYEIGDPAP